MQLQPDCARTSVGNNSSLPKSKDKNFAKELCVRVRLIDRAPPGGGLRASDRPPLPDRTPGRAIALVAWSACLAHEVALLWAGIRSFGPDAALPDARRSVPSSGR